VRVVFCHACSGKRQHLPVGLCACEDIERVAWVLWWLRPDDKVLMCYASRCVLLKILLETRKAPTPRSSGILAVPALLGSPVIVWIGQMQGLTPNC
jgi:hypothetical protein